MIIMHVDVNSAFLSWTSVEALQKGADIDYRTVPAVIGGDEASRHGIVLAKSGPAKKYGISTAETLAEARRKCPGLIVLPPDHELYSRCSDAMYDILCEYSDRIQRFSVDECFLDMTRSPKAQADAVLAEAGHEADVPRRDLPHPHPAAGVLPPLAVLLEEDLLRRRLYGLLEYEGRLGEILQQFRLRRNRIFCKFP